jgi:Ribbon-helix-helix protein, copG family
VRTTITLEDDLAETLKRRARERDVPFKQVVNEAIRAGLLGGTPAPMHYRMKPRNLGVRHDVDLSKALSLAAELEDAEVVRKLEQGR